MNVPRIALDQAKIEQIVTVCQLRCVHSDVLSAFEVETLWLVNMRALELDLSATVTDAEWTVILDAHASLAKVARDRATGLTAELAHHYVGDAVKLPKETA